MKIKMLKSFGKRAENKTYDISENHGIAYIKHGIATEIKTPGRKKG